MAVDWMLNLKCRPKKTLGDGDLSKGSEALLALIKARNRAQLMAKLYRQEGESPKGKTVIIGVLNADGEMEEQEISYEELAEGARLLDELAPDCDDCPANVLGQDFGCTGCVNYPIPASVDYWLADRLQPTSMVGGKLFLAAIRDFELSGEPIRGFRKGGLFELPKGVKKNLNEGRLSSESVSTDQLFEAIFCMNEPLDPGHCIGILLWLGCVRLDREVIETPRQAKIIFEFDEEERIERTSLATGAKNQDEEVELVGHLLRALYRSWILDVPLWISA